MALLVSDEELMKRARQGCRSSFAGLYERHAPRVYRFALQLTGKPPLAEEITQEVFLAVLKTLDQYDAGRGAVVAYLLGVTRNQTYRRLRVERPGARLEDREAELPEVAAGGEAEMLHLSDLAFLRRAVAALPVAYREVIVLCDLEEMDYAQAAQVLGIPLGTVRSRLHRARGLLMEQARAATGQPAGRATK